ncbi:cytochrome c oxidase assembly factor Coa1 family protein [Polyangium sp. y55x31]|uniref:cytochrome c oxidase assembly factor Coa1 family protein n=1 Tax=Polyangium sp. y55x31 TaxID=3042688 RepID=UPI002482E516|nr:cytochrome c oxidase assembly factor Coa1 family protein [Polyangium sp. y55x31]MDI1477988.1 cytochrome c oxidase assembly factor Coa1 family protein [Polyangium sp. y55x31]
MQPVIQPAKKPAGKAMSLLGVLVLFALVASSCVGKYMYTISAPPIARTVELVEKDAAVAAALGSPVSVSLAVGTSLRRDLLRKLRGTDNVDVDTKVKGPKGEARLELRALNMENQGWDGRFSVKMEGRPVLREQGYVHEGASTLLEGNFAPDGAPRVKKP